MSSSNQGDFVSKLSFFSLILFIVLLLLFPLKKDFLLLRGELFSRLHFINMTIKFIVLCVKKYIFRVVKYKTGVVI